MFVIGMDGCQRVDDVGYVIDNFINFVALGSGTYSNESE
jgi:hypothetical protein